MIAEPVTVITDLLLALECFLLGHILFWNDRRKFVRLWALSYLFLGVASVLGAVAHGLVGYADVIPLWNWVWPLTIFSIVTVGLLLNIAWIEEFIFFKKNIFMALFLLVSGFFYLHVFGILNVLTPQGDLTFLVAILAYAPAILLQLAGNFKRYLKNRRLADSMMCNGILLSILGSLIQVFQIAPFQNFNHNDLYHGVQMLALFILYKGLRNK